MLYNSNFHLYYKESCVAVRSVYQAQHPDRNQFIFGIRQPNGPQNIRKFCFKSLMCVRVNRQRSTWKEMTRAVTLNCDIAQCSVAGSNTEKIKISSEGIQFLSGTYREKKVTIIVFHFIYFLNLAGFGGDDRWWLRLHFRVYWQCWNHGTVLELCYCDYDEFILS